MVRIFYYFSEGFNLLNTLRNNERNHWQADVYRFPKNVELNKSFFYFFSRDDHFVCGDFSSHATHPMGGCVTSLDISSGKFGHYESL